MASQGRAFKIGIRTLYTITAVSVVLVIVVAGVAYYQDIHRYPSEQTPLVLHAWGISFVRENPNVQYDLPAPPFANISLVFGAESLSGYGYGGNLSTVPELNASDFTLPDDFAAFEAGHYRWSWMSDEWVEGMHVLGPTGIFITDENGNGLFDYGDTISLYTCVYVDGVLTHQGFYPNSVYELAMEPHDAQLDGNLQFKFAIHHGDLYSWESYWHNF